MKREQLEQILLDVQKPAQYIGGELNSVMKDKSKVDCRLAFCFPDKYEVGMSHLGMKILYSLYNLRENWWCERVFAPDADMEQLMREKNIPLYGLESLDPIKDFDFVLFTLQYEMSYTAILNMLDLAGLPVRAKDRTGLSPIVAAGGPCACNPEPIADFIDLFIIGEGEEVNIEITDLYMQAKKEGWSKQQYLKEAAKIGGVYVPSLYDVSYNEDNTIKAVTPNCETAPAKVKSALLQIWTRCSIQINLLFRLLTLFMTARCWKYSADVCVDAVSARQDLSIARCVISTMTPSTRMHMVCATPAVMRSCR